MPNRGDAFRIGSFYYQDSQGQWRPMEVTDECMETYISNDQWLHGCISEFKIKAKTNHFFSSPSPIRKVIFNDPATIIFWTDGTKTVVKCQDGDKYDKHTGMAMAIAKKFLGNKGRYYEEFKKWIDEVGDN